MPHQVHDDEDGGDTDTDDDISITPTMELIQYLEELYFNSTLTANHLCTITYHLCRMGHPEATKYAHDPRAQTGKFQRTLDAAFDFPHSDDTLYPVNLPCRSARTGMRKVAEVKTKPIHEAIAQEIIDNPDVLNDWRERITDESWIQAYEQHWKVKDATQEERQNILPGVLYMDGASFSSKDSLYVFTVRLAFSAKRHLAWAVRKTDLCDCGCKGWCTFSQLFFWIFWCLQSMVNGVWPALRHDGSELDAKRQSKAGQQLGWHCIIVDICGDWKEFASGWGFPTWSSLFPCFVCNILKSALTNPMSRFKNREDFEYERACQACEIIVPITRAEQLTDIRFKLETDNKKKGLVLRQDVTTTSRRLKAGDRLEPSAHMPDVFKILSLAVENLPVTVTFWRHSKNPIVNHRNPVICAELGIGYSTFSIDVLHCLHLGVFLAYSSRVIWFLLEVDAFGTRETRKDDHLKVSADALSNHLSHWYKGYEKKLEPQAKAGLTKVSYFTDKMLGKPDGKKMIKLKAAESRHFMEFCLDMTRHYKDVLEPVCDYANLLRAGETLHEWMYVVNHNPRKLSPEVVDKLCKLQHSHNVAAQAAGVHMLPKHHQAISFLLWYLSSCLCN